MHGDFLTGRLDASPAWGHKMRAYSCLLRWKKPFRLALAGLESLDIVLGAQPSCGHCGGGCWEQCGDGDFLSYHGESPGDRKWAAG